MTAVERSVEFPGPASPGADAVTAAPRRRRPVLSGRTRRSHLAHQPDAQRSGDGTDQPVRAQHGRMPGMGKRRNGIRRFAARTAGADDDASGFLPDEPTIAAAHRRVPHLRLGRTGRVLESLIPAVLEQRVAGKDAFRAWRLLVTKYGAPAPARHRRECASRRRAMCGAASRPGSSTVRTSTPDERAPWSVVHSGRTPWSGWSALPAERAREALTSLPGVGVWTAAETAQRAFGDADALSVGDYHLAKVVGWSLLGHPIDDAAMIELLEPMRPHRHRAVRLLEVSGLARNPRFGARQAIPNLRAI